MSQQAAVALMGPNTMVERVARNDAELVRVELRWSAVYQSRAPEYTLALAEGLQNNTWLRELTLAHCNVQVQTLNPKP
jgi:hypothetical protein